MEHIHYFGQPFIASEWSHDLYVHDMNIAYAELAGTNKPISLGIAIAIRDRANDAGGQSDRCRGQPLQCESWTRPLISSVPGADVSYAYAGAA